VDHLISINLNRIQFKVQEEDTLSIQEDAKQLLDHAEFLSGAMMMMMMMMMNRKHEYHVAV
jgi:hypothetical protein